MRRCVVLFALISGSLRAYQDARPTRVYRMQERQPVKEVEPVYPALARQRRIEGTVIFVIRVGMDGSILDAKLISGHPLLVRAAAAALLQWVYEPTSAEVITQARVKFRLGNSDLKVACLLFPQARLRAGGLVMRLVKLRAGSLPALV